MKYWNEAGYFPENISTIRNKFFLNPAFLNFYGSVLFEL